eukprot:g440.t1
MDERIITEIFRRFDRNKDGIISREELLAVFDKILPGAKDMDRLIQQMDTNHDGQIQYEPRKIATKCLSEEFVVWILGAGNGDAYDKDRSSLLNAHAQAAHQKVERLRESQTGVKRTALFWGQLSSEQGRASLATLRSDPPRGALAVVCAAHSLLRVSSKKIHWEEAEAMLEDVDAFLMELKEVPAYVVQSFEENLTLPYFDYKRMEERNYACACLGSWRPRVPRSTWLAPGAQVVGDVRLGEEVGVWFNCVLRGDDSFIEVGDRTNIQDLTMVHLDTGCPCIIGREVTVGHACILHGCTVEDEVLIGMGATILNRAVIGRGSVVGARALVLEGMQVPPFSLVVGSPAKVKKTYKEEDRISAQRQHADSYVRKATHFRSALRSRRTATTAGTSHLEPLPLAKGAVRHHRPSSSSGAAGGLEEQKGELTVALDFEAAEALGRKILGKDSWVKRIFEEFDGAACGYLWPAEFAALKARFEEAMGLLEDTRVALSTKADPNAGLVAWIAALACQGWKCARKIRVVQVRDDKVCRSGVMKL